MAVQMKPAGSIIDFATLTLGLDPVTSTVEAIAVVTGRLTRDRRLNHLATINSLLRAESCRNKRDRIAAAKLLVALLPESLGTINQSLNKRKNRWNYELHFSLFCFLDDSQYLRIPAKIKKEICNLVAAYLTSVRLNTALAAWMAGHLLGQHWQGEEALSALKTAALQGRYVAGRKGALGGLKEQLAKRNDHVKAVITDLLKEIASNDRSPRLRQYATQAGSHGQCSPDRGSFPR